MHVSGMALIYTCLQDVRCNLDIVDGPEMVAHVLVLAPASTAWVASRAAAGFSVQRNSA